MSIVSISFICIYVVSIFFMSTYFVRRALASYMEYCFCGRSRTITFIIFTYLGTWIGGGTIVGLAGKAWARLANHPFNLFIGTLVSFLTPVILINLYRLGENISNGF